MEFLGLKEQAHQYGIDGFSSVKIISPGEIAAKCKNFAIVMDGQQRNLNFQI